MPPSFQHSRSHSAHLVYGLQKFVHVVDEHQNPMSVTSVTSFVDDPSLGSSFLCLKISCCVGSRLWCKREGDAGVADWGPRGACGVASAATSCRQCRGGWLPELWEPPQARSKARPLRQASAQVGGCDGAGCVRHPMLWGAYVRRISLSLPPSPLARR